MFDTTTILEMLCAISTVFRIHQSQTVAITMYACLYVL